MSKYAASEKRNEEEVSCLALISQALLYYRYWSLILAAKASKRRREANDHCVYLILPVCNWISVLL